VTALAVAVGAQLLGFSWDRALLLGAVVSSTDAAAVFSVLRGSGVRLGPKTAATLELESGFNDPMAVILTTALTASLAADHPMSLGSLLWRVPMELALGAGVGLALGFLGRRLLSRGQLLAGGLYPVLTLALAGLSFGAATLAHGSGFLAVYVTGILLGNSGRIPYKAGLLRFHDAAAWCGQVGMFLMLGLLVFPSRLSQVAVPGLLLGLFLAVVARPLAAFLCLWPFGFKLREVTLLGWVGLRGAVPIILATFPVMAGVHGAARLFDLVFFVVVVSAFVPGWTVAWVSRKLGLADGDPAPPEAVLEIVSSRPLSGQVISFSIQEGLPVTGATLADVPFPEGAAVMLIVRGETLFAPRGDTLFETGDHVYLFCRGEEDRPFLELLFGRPEA